VRMRLRQNQRRIKRPVSDAMRIPRATANAMEQLRLIRVQVCRTKAFACGTAGSAHFQALVSEFSTGVSADPRCMKLCYRVWRRRHRGRSSPRGVNVPGAHSVDFN
jgi:hypothetical protein